MPCRAPEQRAQARQHLLHVERLGDIIVGAGIHAGNLVAPPLARREDQHRHLAFVAPPLLEHAQAVFLGQAEIEHDGVVGLGVAEEMPLLAVEGRVDGIARIAQRGDELAVQVWIVLDDEKSQSRCPPGLGPSSSLKLPGSSVNGEVGHRAGRPEHDELIDVTDCPPCTGPD